MWLFTKKDTNVVGFIDNRMVKSKNSEPINIQDYESVRLWHPKHESNLSLESIKATFKKQPIQQPFKQIEREFYEADFIKQSKGSKMKKSVLSQLCKNRNWTSSENHTLKIARLNLTAQLLLKESNDDTRGKFYGSENVELGGVEIKIYKKEVSPSEINPVVLSEILRDIDLFINAAKSE